MAGNRAGEMRSRGQGSKGLKRRRRGQQDRLLEVVEEGAWQQGLRGEGVGNGGPAEQVRRGRGSRGLREEVRLMLGLAGW